MNWRRRVDHLDRLQQGERFDILVVGGGATGAGVALDAATRGLSVALVERDDFSAGTSSRSTKLIHGGVRYLERAVKDFDRTQFKLVRDALKERAVLLRNAPHLSQPLPLVTPLYNWLEVPYYLTGLKLYDWLSGKAKLQPSRFVDAQEALQRFPMLKAEGLRGAVVYYDGQFDDARMNVALALTAAEQGAVIANHVDVIALLKEQRKIAGAVVRDTWTGAEWELAASVVVNATGPFGESVRRLDDPGVTPMLSASSGTHIVLDGHFSPPGTGLLIPQTEDGRVLFLLPWLGATLVGTTDSPAEVSDHPKATEDEIRYLLRHIHQYFSIPVSRSDVRSHWSGLRPLVADPQAADTAALSRDHVIDISASGLLTIAGGKWTTYRRMALDTVDTAAEIGSLTPARGSQTETLKLLGGRAFTSSLAGELQEDFGLSAEVSSHLARAYGDCATEVATLASQGFDEPLAAGHPFLDAEVLYAVRHEWATTTTDILARRTRLAFLDRAGALGAIEKVSSLLAGELHWDEAQRSADRSEANAYLG